MKKHLLLIVVLFVSFLGINASAEVPATLNYQGRIVESGQLLNSNDVAMVFTLYDDAVGGVPHYVEAETVDVVDGLYSTVIGDTNTNLLSVLRTLGTNAWLGIVIGGGAELTPRERLRAAPFALLAKALEQDGTGSGLDADFLDGVEGNSFLRSDNTAVYGIGGAYTMTVGSDDILNVDGNAQFENISVGTDSGSDDDYIYFDTGAEYFRWWNSGTEFQLTDHLSVSDDLSVGDGSASDDDAVYFDAGGEWLEWNNADGRFDLSAGLDLDYELSIGNASGSDNDIIFFDQRAQSLYWDNAASRFQFTSTLLLYSNLYVGAVNANDSDYIYFDDGTKFFMWNEPSSRFHINSTLALDGPLLVGMSSSTDNDYIYFDAGYQAIGWQDNVDRFTVGNDLAVNGTIFVGSEGLSPVAYNAIGTGVPDPWSGDMADGNDLFVAQDIEAGFTVYGWNASFDSDVLAKDDLIARDDLYIGDGSTSVLSRAHFSAESAYIQWSPSGKRFELNDDLLASGYIFGTVDLHAGHNVYVGYSDSTDNDFLYFDGTAEYLVWDDANALFYISDDLTVGGSLSKAGGSFRIDHPLDPENKYLNHSFVESPDMKNIYDGVISLDANGEASIELPDWFEALNRDFRYQLTAIGAPAPNLHISEEVSGNSFRIAGGDPGLKVSWMVTGIRKDAWANANRIQIEEDKSPADKGKYLHPSAFGQPQSRGQYASQHKKHIPPGLAKEDVVREKATRPKNGRGNGN